MRFSAVIFDMDGVIIDSEPIWHEVESSFYEDHGGVYGPDILEKLIGTNAMTAASIIKESLDLDWDEQKIIDVRYKKLRQLYHEKLELIPGFVKLINQVRVSSIKCGLASGATDWMIDLVLDRFKLHDAFQYTLSADAVQNPKPAPDVYLATAKKLGIPPKHCVVIEDSPNGLWSAKAAGMKCIVTPNPVLAGYSDFSSADLIRPQLTDVTIRDIMGLL